jgi:hypothetical protein
MQGCRAEHVRFVQLTGADMTWDIDGTYLVPVSMYNSTKGSIDMYNSTNGSIDMYNSTKGSIDMYNSTKGSIDMYNSTKGSTYMYNYTKRSTCTPLLDHYLKLSRKAARVVQLYQ